jgi:hypothetical protein
MSHLMLRRAVALVVAAGLATIVEPASATDHPGGQGRPCFIVQANWNIALDNPQPRC